MSSCKLLFADVWYNTDLDMTNASLNEIKEKAVPILKEAGVTRSSIFGSYVRGDNTEKSDIDILVEFPKGTTLFDVAELQFRLEDALGKSVDLVSYKTIKPKLKQSILSEQVQIL